MGRRPGYIFLQREHAAGQLAHEKTLNIANHQRNANQNHNEIPPHTCQNDYHQKVYKEQMLTRMWKIRPCALLVGIPNGAAATGNITTIMEVPQRTPSGTTVRGFPGGAGGKSANAGD